MSVGTVLIVDDEEPLQEVLAAALKDAGYQVLVSHDQAAGLVAHDKQPGVILLDLDMVGMAGVEVSKRLRADKATMHIPLITLSVVAKGWATQGVVADDFMDKPFHLAALYEVVAKWMPPAGRAVTR